MIQEILINLCMATTPVVLTLLRLMAQPCSLIYAALSGIKGLDEEKGV